MEAFVYSEESRTVGSRFHEAVKDIVDGVVYRGNLWGALARQDIKQRYRRSVLGPFWLTITTAIFVSALGFLYSELFKQSLTDYVPYIAIGYIVWSFVSSIVLEACHVFISAENMIKQVRQPFTTYVCRMVFRNLIIFAHNAVILLVVIITVENTHIGQLLSIVPAVLLLSVLGVFLGIIFGVMCVRFRDIIPMVGSVVQVTFFLTPIFWRADILTERAWMVEVNPAHHLIDIVRSPALGEGIPVDSWLFALGLTGAMAILAVLIYTLFRHRIAYWVG